VSLWSVFLQNSGDSRKQSEAGTQPSSPANGSRFGIYEMLCQEHFSHSILQSIFAFFCATTSTNIGFGRYFPSSIRSLAQVDSCQHMIKHVTLKCTKIPPELRKQLLDMGPTEAGGEGGGHRSRYGSRKMFFRRVWSRLHGESVSDKASHSNGASEGDDVKSSSAAQESLKQEWKKEDTTDWEKVLDGATIVSLDDQGLISPAQFAAMAQMKACRLTKTDKTGWYKDRPIGFGGFCCRHCGGKASFGRYFVRSSFVLWWSIIILSVFLISPSRAVCLYSTAQQCPQLCANNQQSHDYHSRAAVPGLSRLYPQVRDQAAAGRKVAARERRLRFPQDLLRPRVVAIARSRRRGGGRRRRGGSS